MRTETLNSLQMEVSANEHWADENSVRKTNKYQFVGMLATSVRRHKEYMLPNKLGTVLRPLTVISIDSLDIETNENLFYKCLLLS